MVTMVMDFVEVDEEEHSGEYLVVDFVEEDEEEDSEEGSVVVDFVVAG